MKVEELRQLVRWLEEARIGAFEIESGDCRLRLTLQPNATRAGPLSVTIDGEGSDEGNVVAAELPGIFLVRHPQRATPVIPLGGSVRADDLVGFIQIGAVVAPVITRRGGTLMRILAVPESLVGAGTPLFEIA